MGPTRKVKQAVFEMFKAPSEGDLLMDAPKTSSWRELCKFAFEDEQWKARVRALKFPQHTTTTLGPYHEPEQTVAFTISS